MRSGRVALLAALIACVVGGPSQAANLLVNGDFEAVTMPNGGAQHSTIIGNGSDGLAKAAGWTTTGYNFIFTDNPSYGGATATGADDYFDGAYTSYDSNGNGEYGLSLHGPDWLINPTSNGLTNSPLTNYSGAPGGGGNFVGADGAYLNRPIEQVVSDLVPGREYSVSFWWAAGQQSQHPSGYDGETTEAWTICFGTCSYAFDPDEANSYAAFNNVAGQDSLAFTGERTNAEHGFVPWKYEYFTFTAQSSTQTLSLLAYGTPVGQPPFSLIDNIELNPVPEPTTWAMMMIGFGVIGGVLRTRRHSLNGRRALKAQII